MSGQFQHNLCGCFDNCCICIVTYFCPCYTAGKIAEKVGKSCCVHAICMFIPIAGLVCRTIVRGDVREQRNINGNTCNDFMVSWCCAFCALCQEAQEVGAFGQGMAVNEFAAVEVMERE